MTDGTKAVGLALGVLAGLTAFVAWVEFWKTRDDHGWPFLLCFGMAILLPVSIGAGVLFYLAQIGVL